MRNLAPILAAYFFFSSFCTFHSCEWSARWCRGGTLPFTLINWMGLIQRRLGMAGPYLPTLNTMPAPTVDVPLAVPPNTRPAFTSMRTWGTGRQ